MGRWCRLVCVVVAVALGVGLAPVSAGAKDSEPKKPKAPKEWDERVQPFVDFVEGARHLEFEHPVVVRFLADKAFEKEIRSDAQLTKEEKALNEQISGELLALGLVGEKVDLGQATEDLDASSTVGFYDSETEELVVRGIDATAIDARVTIVHELTHALQDQHFDLDALYDDAKEGSEVYALDFLVEGDATTVENAYLDTLSPAEQEEYFGSADTAPEQPLPEDIPYALDIFSSAPYVLGTSFLFALDPDGGTAGRDRAFEKPPTTEELLIDPVALQQRQAAKKVADPKLSKGEHKAYDPEQFGVISLYLILATRLDVRTALAAVTGWGGDRGVGFKKDGDACVRVNVTGDTTTDTDELEAALTAWKGTMPAGAVEVKRSADVVTFTACEAKGVTAPADAVFDSAFYNVLADRIGVVLDVAAGGVPLGTALCVGDLVSTDPEVVALFDRVIAEGRDPTDAEFVAVDDAYNEAYPACGA